MLPCVASRAANSSKLNVDVDYDEIGTDSVTTATALHSEPLVDRRGPSAVRACHSVGGEKSFLRGSRGSVPSWLPTHIIFESS